MYAKTSAAAAKRPEAIQVDPVLAPRRIETNRPFERGDVESAIRHFTAAVERSPAFGEACHNLGVALLQAGRPADAIAPLRRAADLLPQDAGNYNSLGIAYARTARFDEARAAFERAVGLDPARSEYRINLDGLRPFRGGR